MVRCSSGERKLSAHESRCVVEREPQNRQVDTRILTSSLFRVDVRARICRTSLLEGRDILVDVREMRAEEVLG